MKIRPIAPNSRFGKWKTTGEHRFVSNQSKRQPNGRRLQSEVICDCSLEVKRWVLNCDLRNGGSSQCDEKGCQRTEATTARNTIIRWHRARVKKAGGRITDALTDEEVFSLSQASCALCGDAPATPVVRYADGVVLLLRNGIDRIDSSIGYTTDNSRPCCKICNYIKGTLPDKEMWDHLNKMTRQKANNPPPSVDD